MPALTADSNTLKRLTASLFTEETGRTRFIEALVHPADCPVAVVWVNDRPVPNPFDMDPRPQWMPDFVDVVSFEQRPGRHELHAVGAYYCMDPSSVFASQVLSVLDPDAIHTIFDLCASPGGKTVLASQMLQPKRIVCNEVIRKRTAQLKSNLNRCRIDAAEVVSCDVARLADRHTETADVVIVDAPCSGQSLIARGKESPGCFHPATINMNANRQRRILANAVRLVRPGGHLAYMTCTFSIKENERNLEWLLKQAPDFSAMEVPVLAAHHSPFSEIPSYRIWPFDSIGAGGFTSILHRQS
jgi:16S rRNA C967 or C1407 C5-methylase (RsmB/RsmF family)